MKVQELNSGLRQLDYGKFDRPDPQTTATSGSKNESVHGDRLDLTVSAKAATESLVNEATVALQDNQISPERKAEIRGRIQSDFYALPAALSLTADSIKAHFS